MRLQDKNTRIILGIIAALFVVVMIVMRQPTSEEATIAQSLGEDCEFVSACADIYQIACRTEGKGPIYYISKATQKIVARCDYEACDTSPELCVNCPPAEWTCK